MKAIASYWKDTVAVFLMVSGGVMLRNSFSDFPSTNYAKYHSTKRKSVKNASDSSINFIFAELCITFLDLLLLCEVVDVLDIAQ